MSCKRIACVFALLAVTAQNVTAGVAIGGSDIGTLYKFNVSPATDVGNGLISVTVSIENISGNPRYNANVITDAQFGVTSGLHHDFGGGGFITTPLGRTSTDLLGLPPSTVDSHFLPDGQAPPLVIIGPFEAGPLVSVGAPSQLGIDGVTGLGSGLTGESSPLEGRELYTGGGVFGIGNGSEAITNLAQLVFPDDNFQIDYDFFVADGDPRSQGERFKGFITRFPEPVLNWVDHGDSATLQIVPNGIGPIDVEMFITATNEISSAALADPSIFSTPLSGDNPITGMATSGLQLDLDNNQLFASFSSSDIHSTTPIDFLTLDYAGAGQISAGGLIDEEGLSFADLLASIEITEPEPEPEPEFQWIDHGDSATLQIVPNGSGPIDVEVSISTTNNLTEVVLADPDIFITPNPGENPNTGTSTSGLQIDLANNQLFASFSTSDLDSTTPIDFLTIAYDGAGQIYANGLVFDDGLNFDNLLASIEITQSSDFDKDGDVDGDDFGVFTGEFRRMNGGTPYGSADLNRDGVVNEEDNAMFVGKFNDSVPATTIPEPTAALLLLVGVTTVTWTSRRSP